MKRRLIGALVAVALLWETVFLTPEHRAYRRSRR